MPSLLVTNDFPPKIGGIQSYLYELWRRLPAGETTVLTTPHPGTAEFDRAQAFRIERTKERVLMPTGTLARRIDALAREVSADVVFLDPVLPLGALAGRLTSAPHVLVVHGAEVSVPRRLPGIAHLAGRILRGAAGVVAAGEYPAREANRCAHESLRGVVVAPGVDVSRFRPGTADERAATRARLGLSPGPVVLGLSRLVPRKGFDVLIDALATDRDVQLVIGGAGRDRRRLEQRAGRCRLDVRFLGRVPDAELPALYAAADVFAMPCRERWAGLEAEGFGIVFLEAAACGVPAVAGASGGSHEAVIDGATGFVVPPDDVGLVHAALTRLIADPSLRAAFGAAGRRHAEGAAYERRVETLAPLAAGDLGVLEPLDA